MLWNGAVDLKNFKIIVDRVINQYFKQPNYFKIDDKPILSVFSIQNLIEGLGGLEQARQAIDYFREETQKAGFPGLHLQLIGNGEPNQNLLKTIEKLRANSITKYNWGVFTLKITSSGEMNQCIEENNGMMHFLFPISLRRPLVGMIHQDFHKKGKRILCITANPSKFYRFLSKSKKILP